MDLLIWEAVPNQVQWWAKFLVQLYVSKTEQMVFSGFQTSSFSLPVELPPSRPLSGGLILAGRSAPQDQLASSRMVMRIEGQKQGGNACGMR